MTRLLLASGSETRRRMLADAGVAFEVQPSPADEEAAKRQLLAQGVGATDLALALSELKALAVAADPDVLVLGSDQVLELDDGSMLNKARSLEEAADQLRSMSGRPHRLQAAAALASAGELVWRGVETVHLRMRPLTETFISDYLAAEFSSVRYDVGVYRIEGPGVQLFDEIEGSHFAILGMPLLPLLGELRRRDVLAS